MTLILATRNQHKAGEIRAMLSNRFKCRTLNDFPGAPAVIEDAGTFAGNARKKSMELARWLAKSGALPAEEGDAWVLADDSGLEVDALNGAPGVHSARFAANTGDTGNCSDAANNAKLLRLLEGVSKEKRSARFRCVLALTPAIPADQSGPLPHDSNAPAFQTQQLFEGVCEGQIAVAPSGNGGFGYDPLFVPSGHTRSFAELGEEIKNRISHRAQALFKLREFLPGHGIGPAPEMDR